MKHGGWSGLAYFVHHRSTIPAAVVEQSNAQKARFDRLAVVVRTLIPYRLYSCVCVHGAVTSSLPDPVVEKQKMDGSFVPDMVFKA